MTSNGHWIWFRPDPYVHGLSTNGLKTYVIQYTQSIFIFGYFKNILMQKWLLDTFKLKTMM